MSNRVQSCLLDDRDITLFPNACPGQVISRSVLSAFEEQVRFSACLFSVMFCAYLQQGICTQSVCVLHARTRERGGGKWDEKGKHNPTVFPKIVNHFIFFK